jgi:hypothetical protein
MLKIGLPKILIMKIVVYTCISGLYDTLKDPSFVNKEIDYICFTD